MKGDVNVQKGMSDPKNTETTVCLSGQTQGLPKCF